jgi:carbon-monoxide dehydrogenase medium subunit
MLLPTTVEECLSALARRDGNARAVAGGTDLLPQMKNGVVKPATVIDLSGIAALRRVTASNGAGLRIGAGATARQLELDPEVRRRYPAIAESAALVGSVQVRNLATVGGNLCNAAPSADMAPPLLALEAEAIVASPRGERRVPLATFFQGVRRTLLEPDELLIALQVPAQAAGSGGSYIRHTPRRELDIAVVGVASQVTVSDGRISRARVALASVAPTPVRATAAERALEGQPPSRELLERAATLAIESAQPISDQRGSADFRRHLVRVLTRRTLNIALARASA